MSGLVGFHFKFSIFPLTKHRNFHIKKLKVLNLLIISPTMIDEVYLVGQNNE